MNVGKHDGAQSVVKIKCAYTFAYNPSTWKVELGGLFGV